MLVLFLNSAVRQNGSINYFRKSFFFFRKVFAAENTAHRDYNPTGTFKFSKNQKNQIIKNKVNTRLTREAKIIMRIKYETESISDESKYIPECNDFAESASNGYAKGRDAQRIFTRVGYRPLSKL